MTKTIDLSIYDIKPNLRVINLYQCSAGFNSGIRKLYDHYFLYVHKGKGNVIIDNKKYDATRGDLFFCPPNCPNTIIADKSDPFLLTGISFDFTLNFKDKNFLYSIQNELFNTQYISEYINFTDFEGFPQKNQLPEDKLVRQMIYDMVGQFNTRKRYWDIYINGIMQAFIGYIVQTITNKEIGRKNKNKGDEIIKYITDNYMKCLNNSDIAKKFHYNVDYINRIVFLYTGMTIKQYIIDLRIREAINLLRNTDINIGDIANRVGYNNIYYFSRLFKSLTGLPPSEFRRR